VQLFQGAFFAFSLALNGKVTCCTFWCIVWPHAVHRCKCILCVIFHWQYNKGKKKSARRKSCIRWRIESGNVCSRQKR